jgi:pSer/pThr/pTyr-binding forkhead associated (FHA) protein
MLSAKLVVVGGDVKTTEIKLRLPAIIGRGKGSTITLLQPLVSRQHCELFETNGKLWVRDLGSLNGTYVNNEKVTESEIPPNELLTVGTVTFRAVYEPLGGASAPAEPVPQFLPSKAQPEDDQPTVKVDSPSDLRPVETVEVVEAIELEGEGEGVPSTPLFEAEPARPAPQRPTAPRPAAPAPARPTIPSAVTTDVPAAKPAPAPVAAKPAPVPAKEEPEEEDDDLNDFLKSLGKK